MDEFAQPIEDRKVERGVMVFGAVFSMLLGIGVFIFFILKVSDSHSIPEDGQYLNLPNFGAFGDFIGGVIGTLFSLAGVFLLYLTLKDQRDNFHRERIESNFFDMIKFHRENVNELAYSYYESDDEMHTAYKRKVFKLIFSQYKEAWVELEHFFKDSSIDSIYDRKYLEKLRANPLLKARQIDLKLLGRIDITYLIVFFGLSSEDKITILQICSNVYDGEFVKKVLNFASLKPKRESKFWNHWQQINQLKNRIEVFEDLLQMRQDSDYKPKVEVNWLVKDNTRFPFEPFYPDSYTKYNGGHQFRLGHYYRHLFQTVRFIDKQQYLTNEEKYHFVKILRGQLSNYEQIMLFLNSTSQLGRTWELVRKNKPEKEMRKKRRLLSKYNLIKNIPTRYVLGEIDLLQCYPEIQYEAIVK